MKYKTIQEVLKYTKVLPNSVSYYNDDLEWIEVKFNKNNPIWCKNFEFIIQYLKRKKLYWQLSVINEEIYLYIWKYETIY